MTDPNVYTLSDIVHRLGSATEAEVRLELEGFTNEDFIAKGRRIGTPRLVKELARNYGIMVDWFAQGTPQQKELLGFVGADWLRIAAFAAHQAETRHEELSKGTSLMTATKEVRTSHADDLMHRLKLHRERIYTALQNVAAGLPQWKSRVDGAYSTPDTLVPMTDALDALAAVAEKMLTDATQGMTLRLARNNITATAIQSWRTMAQTARDAQKAANAVAPATTVTQADVDLWDGMAISLFEQFVDAVEDAHHIDPAIPKPSIIGLRSWFGRASKKDAPTEDASTSGTTSTPSGTP
ncbi:MAG TPA: hypothetical protein PK156_05790 [Polyangium sp.]|nr:hypothetical protein [Polyangium sp.]